jgi:uncharacterized membrane protein
MVKKREHLLSVVVMLLVIFPVSVYSALETVSIAPPDVPSFGYINNENISVINISLNDWKNLQVSNVHVVIALRNQTATKKMLEYSQSGNLILHLNKDVYELELMADSLDTPGGDYYYRGVVDANSDVHETIQFLPAGSLRGTVYQNNQIIENAIVKFVCGKQYGQVFDTATDVYGSFSDDYLPVGECRIYAKKNDAVGFMDVNIKAGEIASIDVLLNKHKSNTMQFFLIGLLVVVGIIVILIVLYLHMIKKNSSKRTANEKESAGIQDTDEHLEQQSPAYSNGVLALNKNKRARDILKTMSPKEKQLVEQLWANKEMYQNRIVHETGIPKTTLVRILYALEQKNIIAIQKIGKTKKIKLTKWFLSDE